MAGKFGKFLAFTAITAAACGAVYYVLGNKKEEDYSLEDGGASDFFEKKAEREYVSINTDEIKETVEELKDKAAESKDVIMGKLNEAAEQLKPWLDYDRQIVASMVGGVGLKDLQDIFRKPSPSQGNGEGGCPALYYLIPNTAIAVRQSMTFLSSVGATKEPNTT